MVAPRHVEQAARALRDGTHLRAVVRARIGAASYEEARRARFALEDALNTADFGDCGRLIVVRALSLGRLPAGASPWSIARAVEQAWRQVAGRAVAFSAPGAVDAPAVYFASLAEAQVAYVRTAVHGEAAAAWFWPRALPELAGAASPADAVVRVMLAIAPEAVAVLADDVVRWEAHALTALEALLPASPPAAVQGALDRLAFAEAEASWTGRTVSALARGPAHGVHVSALREVAAALPVLRARARGAPAAAADWPRTWVSGLLLRGVLGRPVARAVVERTMQAASVRMPLPAHDRLLAPGVDGPEAPGAPVASLHAVDERFVAGEALEASPMAPLPSPDRPGSESSAPSPQAAMTESRGAPLHAVAKRPLGARVPWLASGEPTEWAGLLMLLTVLEALGAERWIRAQRREVAAVFARAWLEALADRLHVPTDDGVRTAISTTAEERDAFERSRADWTDFAWPAWCDAPLPRARSTSAAHALAVWRVAVRRSLRRHAGIGVVALGRRPGLVVATATHVDVTLPLAATDLRARRHGLDRDPGWVPWFGRIVAFHFVGSDVVSWEVPDA